LATSRHETGTTSAEDAHANEFTLSANSKRGSIAEDSKHGETDTHASEQAWMQASQTGLAAEQVPTFQAWIEKKTENLSEEAMILGQQALDSSGEELAGHIEMISANVQREASDILSQAVDSLADNLTEEPNEKSKRGVDGEADVHVYTPAGAQGSFLHAADGNAAQAGDTDSATQILAFRQAATKEDGSVRIPALENGTDIASPSKLEVSTQTELKSQSSNRRKNRDEDWSHARVHVRASQTEHLQSSVAPQQSSCDHSGLKRTEGAAQDGKIVDVAIDSVDDVHAGIEEEKHKQAGCSATGGTAVTVARGKFIEFQNSALWAAVRLQLCDDMQSHLFCQLLEAHAVGVF
jgi:hypothetical protein